MKLKRFKHSAFTFCHMFCGYQIFFDYSRLIELGEGHLMLDVLTADCAYNDKKIRSLSIADAISSWFREDCQANDIDIGLVRMAKLDVDLELSVIAAHERTDSLSEQFFIRGRELKTSKMNRCRFICEGLIQTEHQEFRETYVRVREWPIGWPQDL